LGAVYLIWTFFSLYGNIDYFAGISDNQAFLSFQKSISARSAAFRGACQLFDMCLLVKTIQSALGRFW